ncbi:MAG: hypothetical protein QNJ20_11000 [Paracoccaceae bacterium]|nr:hypothetical protein [Paracoccaceae bacterium]
MTALRKGYRGLRLLAQLNADRVFVAVVLGGALYLGAYIGSHL